MLQITQHLSPPCLHSLLLHSLLLCRLFKAASLLYQFSSLPHTWILSTDFHPSFLQRIPPPVPYFHYRSVPSVNLSIITANKKGFSQSLTLNLSGTLTVLLRPSPASHNPLTLLVQYHSASLGPLYPSLGPQRCSATPFDLYTSVNTLKANIFVVRSLSRMLLTHHYLSS